MRLPPMRKLCANIKYWFVTLPEMQNSVLYLHCHRRHFLMRFCLRAVCVSHVSHGDVIAPALSANKLLSR